MYNIEWLNTFFIYGSYVIGLIIVVLVFKLSIKLNKDIKKLDKSSKENMIKYMRQTSKYNKK